VESLNTLPYGKRFLPSSLDATTGKPLPDSFLVPYVGLGSITYGEPIGTSNYYSLQLQANRRFSQGLEFQSNFTWSKSMDYNSSTRANGASFTPTFLSARRNYGPSDFDQKYIFSVNAQYDVPGWKSGSKVVSGVSHNWVFAMVGVFNTGTPITINPTLLGNTLGGGDFQRVNVSCNPNLERSAHTATAYFDTSCVQYPGATYGNEGRGVLRGPGRNNFDMTLSRNFNLGSEKRVMTFRFEAYNVFNHTQFNGVSTNLTLANFGVVTSARPGRINQLGLKFLF